MTLRLTSRIVLIFMLLAAVLLATVGILSYRDGSESLKAAATSEMLTIAIEKEAAIETWVEERMADFRQIASDPGIIEKSAMLVTAAPESDEGHSAHDFMLKELAPRLIGPNAGFLELFVIGVQGGKVIVSTSPAEEGKSKIGYSYFDKGKTELFLQEPYLSADLKVPAMTLAVPLRLADGRVVAVLAARLDLAALSTIAQRRTGLHKSEDSYLVNTERFFITQPRFISKPVVLLLKNDTEAIRRCVARDSGVVLAPDYRGVPVFSAYRWMATHQFGLSVEIDEAEVLAPVHAFGQSVLLISTLALLVTAGLAFMLARTITRPLTALHARVRGFAEEKIQEPLTESSSDEVGLLAREFNQLTIRVRQRTAELAEANQALLKENIERKRVANALFESNEKFQLLVDNITDAFWIRSPDMREVHYVSPAFERIWGRSAKSLYANPYQWADFTLPEDRERVLGAFTALTKDASSLDIEYRIVLPDGEIRWIRARGFQVRDAAGKLIRLTGIVSDITEHKLIAETMTGLNKQLVIAARQSGMAEVASSVLHNAGNVLNSINVSATLVSDQLKHSRLAGLVKVAALMREHEGQLHTFIEHDPRGQKLPEYINMLATYWQREQADTNEELKNLNQNIQHVKDIISMQQSLTGISGIKEPAKISHVIQNALKIVDASFKHHSITVTCDFEDVPASLLEKSKLLQILVNLLQNANDAVSGLPEIARAVSIKTRVDESNCTVTVSDNGVGLKADDLTRIFSFGFSTKPTGHGIGLHISALSAQDMGGTLKATSEGPGKGAAFLLKIPYKAIEAQI